MLESLTGIWGQILSIFDQFPEESVAVFVYVAGTIIALWCWYRLMSRLPNPMGGILWIMVFAILVTPSVSEGSNAALAPAIFGLLFGVLTQEYTLVWSNLSLILFVMSIGFVIGFCWSKYSANKTVRSI